MLLGRKNIATRNPGSRSWSLPNYMTVIGDKTMWYEQLIRYKRLRRYATDVSAK